MYEVEIDDADLELVAEALRQMGVSEPTDTVTDSVADDESVQKGWSNGVDNRIDRGIARHGGWPAGANVWPYRTIGQLKPDGSTATTTGNCTATFVGSAGDANTRYILSAAHCYWDPNTGNYLDPDFWPRQDRCLDNQGNAVANCQQGPYGEWDGGVWMMYTYYVNNCIAMSPSTDDCKANDIAVQRVHRQTGASFSGAQGFGPWKPTDLTGFTKYHRGYPNCSGPGDPNPSPPTICLPRTLYGDGAFSISSGDMHDAGDWPRRYLFSSDVSAGHSGGPAYFSSGGNHYVFGVAVWQDCVGASCSGTLTACAPLLRTGTT